MSGYHILLRSRSHRIIHHIRKTCSDLQQFSLSSRIIIMYSCLYQHTRIINIMLPTQQSPILTPTMVRLNQLRICIQIPILLRSLRLRDTIDISIHPLFNLLIWITCQKIRNTPDRLINQPIKPRSTRMMTYIPFPLSH